MSQSTTTKSTTHCQSTRSSSQALSTGTLRDLSNQELSNLPQDLGGNLRTRRQKRSDNSEEHDSNTQKQAAPQLALVREPLSEENLQTHTELLEMIDISDDESERPLTASSTTGVQETALLISQKSSGGAAGHYRWTVLNRANVHIMARPPPPDVQAQVDAILQSNSLERKKSHVSTAETLCNDFASLLHGEYGEYEFVCPFYTALASMNQLERLSLSTKAAWRRSLRPHMRPWPSFDLSFLMKPQSEIDDNSVGPIIPQPQQEESMGNSAIKTPRPHITVGIRRDVLIERLSAEILSSRQAEDLLYQFQETAMIRNGHHEPILCSTPFTLPSQTLFPFLIVEAKSYAGGQPIFEAHNQAAVSGAAALKILHDLADLADRADDVSPPSSPAAAMAPVPPVFTICTQGPIHELWVNYTTLENGLRTFHMTLLTQCDASLLPSTSDFVAAVHNIMRWAETEYLDGIVQQLRKVALRVFKKK